MDEQFRELTDRGSFLFPFESYHTLDSTGNFYVSCHWHPDTEIVYLQNGSVKLFIDGESYFVEAGTVCFINREELHYLYSAEAGTLYDAAVFPLEFLAFDSMDYCQQKYILPLIRRELLFPRFLRPGDPCFDTVRSQLLLIAGFWMDQAPGYQMGIKAALYQIVSCLIREDCLTSASSAKDGLSIKKLDTMKQMIAYIEAHVTEKLSLERIASHFYMTPNYFCKYFKRNFGTGFTGYLNSLRLEKACLLLAKTDLPIMEISLQCGFDNFSYFIRLFKRQQGVTPSAYRKQFLAV